MNEATGLMFDESVCDSCGRSAFAYDGELRDEHWTKWSAAYVRQYLAKSRCVFCDGRPLVPVEKGRA